MLKMNKPNVENNPKTVFSIRNYFTNFDFLNSFNESLYSRKAQCSSRNC
ncbi:hypothetical protein T190130A13A_90064 [Tenacibaculum sp. 190130A14a]|uniref:Uncharacterized protein n=1 Tax=Tenacibaculum polynesiense TaxID=3137857 RepID=A0ABM9P6S7_9FLAO